MAFGVAVRVRRVVAHEGDAGAVRRPRRRGLVVVFTGGEAVELFGGDVEQVDVAVAAGEQVARAVLFELVAIDDDRFGRLAATAGGPGSARFRRGFGVGIGIADDQRETL